MALYRGFFKNNQFKLLSCLTFMPKIFMGLLKMGVSFHGAIKDRTPSPQPPGHRCVDVAYLTKLGI